MFRSNGTHMANLRWNWRRKQQTGNAHVLASARMSPMFLMRPSRSQSPLMHRLLQLLIMITMTQIYRVQFTPVLCQLQYETRASCHDSGRSFSHTLINTSNTEMWNHKLEDAKYDNMTELFKSDTETHNNSHTDHTQTEQIRLVPLL